MKRMVKIQNPDSQAALLGFLTYVEKIAHNPLLELPMRFCSFRVFEISSQVHTPCILFSRIFLLLRVSIVGVFFAK